VRTIPGRGVVICNGQDANLDSVIDQGCWSELQHFSMLEDTDWQVELLTPDGRELKFFQRGNPVGSIEWSQCGNHNAMNALAALAASVAAGVDLQQALQGLSTFSGVKRRMELISDFNDILVYDDFAHHPTAIRLTLEGLRRNATTARLLVALEPRSNTMRAGVHIAELAPALAAADQVWMLAGGDIEWEPMEALRPLDGRGRVVTRSEDLLQQMLDQVQSGDRVVFMSNGGFDAVPQRFCESLRSR